MSAVDPVAQTSPSPKKQPYRSRSERAKIKQKQTFRKSQATSNYPFADDEQSVMADILRYPESTERSPRKGATKPQERSASCGRETPAGNEPRNKKRYRVQARPRQWKLLQKTISGETQSKKDTGSGRSGRKNTLAEEDRISYYSDSEVVAVYPKWWPSDEDSDGKDGMGREEELQSLEIKDSLHRREQPEMVTDEQEEVWEEKERESMGNNKGDEESEICTKNRGNTRSSKTNAARNDIQRRRREATKNKAKQDGTLDKVEREKDQQRQQAKAFRQKLKMSADARERFLGIPKAKQRGYIRGQVSSENSIESSTVNTSTSGQSGRPMRSIEGSRVQAKSKSNTPSHLKNVQSRIKDRIKHDIRTYRKQQRPHAHVNVCPDGEKHSEENERTRSSEYYDDREKNIIAQANERYKEGVEKLLHDDFDLRAKPEAISWTIPLDKDENTLSELDIPTPPAQVARELQKQKRTPKRTETIAKDSVQQFKNNGQKDPQNRYVYEGGWNNISLKSAASRHTQSEERIVEEAEEDLDSYGLRVSTKGSPEAVRATYAAEKAHQAYVSSVDPLFLQRKGQRPPPHYSLHQEKAVQSAKSEIPRVVDNMKYLYGGEYMSESDRNFATQSGNRYTEFSTPLQIARGFLNGPVMAAYNNKESSLWTRRQDRQSHSKRQPPNYDSFIGTF